jgi:hypothetical protein
LLKKGGLGPSFCHLCRCYSESTDHLFINFLFTRQVLHKTTMTLNLTSTWDGFTLPDCFKTWAQKEHKHMHLSSIICWMIWLERNNTIF